MTGPRTWARGSTRALGLEERLLEILGGEADDTPLGDERASQIAEVLYCDLHGKVLSWAVRALRVEPHDAEDFAHSFWAHLLTKLRGETVGDMRKRWRGEAQIHAYVRTAVKRRYLDSVRTRQSREASLTAREVPAVRCPSEDARTATGARLTEIAISRAFQKTRRELEREPNFRRKIDRDLSILDALEDSCRTGLELPRAELRERWDLTSERLYQLLNDERRGVLRALARHLSEELGLGHSEKAGVTA